MGTTLATSEIFRFHTSFKTIEKKQVQLQAFQCQFNRGVYSNCLNLIFETAYDSPCIQPEEQIFGAKMATSGNFHSTYNSKPLKKRSSFIDLLVSV